MVGLGALALAFSVSQASQAPSQVYYVPFPESDQLAAFVGVTAVAVDPLNVFVTFAAANDNTVIYYDHWEDGYETDIANSKQSTTEVWGDGNPANGYPPGNPGDLITAGSVFSLRNYVTSTAGASVFKYDARDKIASFKPITLTKTSYPASTGTLLAGCVEVFEQGLWGTEYRVPVGSDMPTTGTGGTLTYDADMFAYTSMSIMAGAGGATVDVDSNNDGSYEQANVVLSEGQSIYVTNVRVGGHVLASKPVQVVMFTGRPTSNYQSRDTSLLPVNRWSSSYYAPVSTNATYGTAVFLYNPGVAAITVSYDCRSSATAYSTATVSVPAGGNARVTLTPAETPTPTTHYGAYHFYTTGTTPATFYAFCAVDGASATITNNQAYDGGFTLVGQPSLTTQIQVSLGIGRDPYATTNPTENGNPVWITTVGNGHTLETVYVDYNGDNAGAYTDPNGNKYDASYSLRELQQQQLIDPDGDQSGMVVYVLNPNVKLAAAWAQNSSLATAGAPGLDVSTLIPPLREGDASKGSSVMIDADGDGYRSAGDTLEYDIRVINTAHSSLNGPFTVKDNLPANLGYVARTTRYRYSVHGAWQVWTDVPDDDSGTAFPLDGAGLAIPGTLGFDQQIQVTFQAVIATYPDLTPVGTSAITNTGSVEVTPLGLNIGLNWSDPLYGSIGDRVWTDTNANGVQDSGEAGLNGVIVYADLNSNGVRDANEPTSTTTGDGAYVLTGLVAGTHTVRVDPASVAAIDPKHGPTYDVDGIATSYVASVVLAAAQDRTDVDFGFRAVCSVGDRVWVDRNANGVQESGEPGINGVRVYIDSNHNNSYDVGEPNSLTFGDGTYYIGNLAAGTHEVRVDNATLPAGATQTYDDATPFTDNEAAVTLTNAQHNPNLDFGYRGALSIGDLVWEDTNANAAKDTAEPGLANIRVYIDANGNGVWDSTEAFALTNASGIYSIGNLFNGNYVVRVDAATLPASMFQTYDLTSPTTDDQATAVLAGTSLITLDFGYRYDATIGDRVWNDRDNDGVQDSGEAGIEGGLVYIDANTNSAFDSATERYAITDVNGNYLIDNLAAGTYSVRVDIGTLPQGSTQTYDLDGTATANVANRTLTANEDAINVDFGYRGTASAGDFVWTDTNGNGIQDAGETGINGVRVYLDINGNDVFDSSTEPSAITNSSGAYSITGLVAGTYTARIDTSTLPTGVVPTHDLTGPLDHAATFSLSSAQARTDLDFGYVAPVTLGDKVWNDLNANGVQDAGEPGLDGITVTLFNATDHTIAGTTITAGGGLYAFTNQIPATYYLGFGSLTGYSRTFANPGADDTRDSDAIASTGRTGNYVLAAGTTNNTIDAGYFQAATIGHFVFADTNANGIQDAGETGLAGVLVSLYRPGYGPDGIPGNADDSTTVAGMTTPASGAYSFAGLPLGSYQVGFGALAGYGRTPTDQGADDTRDSDANAGTGLTGNYVLAAGATNNTIDAGYYQTASIGDFVFNDLNANGLQDAGETGLAGVLVSVYCPGYGADGIAGNADDALAVAVMTTPAGGAYSFTGLRPGTYQVGFGALSGYNRTLADQRADDTKDSDANLDTGLTGNYVLAGGATNNTIDAGYYAPTSIGDFVFNDANANGVQDAGETGLAGVLVSVYRPGVGPDGIAGTADDAQAVASQTTPASGGYSFTGLPPGTYQVGFGTLSGYNRTLADQGADDTKDSDANAGTGLTGSYVLAAGASNTAIDAGYYAPVTVGDFVFNDVNANAVQDAGETGLAGVLVSIYRPSYGADGIAGTADDALAVASQTTPAGGAYSFTGLRPGTYQVGFGALSGYNRTLADQGADEAADSDANAGTGLTGSCVVAAGTTDNTIDAGYYQPVTIGNFVFVDANYNGVQDAGETGLAGVLVSVYRPGYGPDGIAGTADDATAVASMTTPAGGAYSFTGLPPGTYQVGFGTLAGYGRTLADQGADDTKDSDANMVTGMTGSHTLAAGESNINVDAGCYQVASLAGAVRVDVNGNGVIDAGDAVGLAGVTVLLQDASSNVVATTTTSVTGGYSFTNLAPGNYTAVQLLPTGYSNTLDAVPPNDLRISRTLTSGQSSTGNDFYDTRPTVPAAQGKVLYLSDPSQALDRVDPVASGDSMTATTATLAAHGVLVDATTNISDAWSPLAFDAASTTSGNNSTFTFSHTTGAGADRLLLVGVSMASGNASVTNVTYGGTGLTLVGARSNGSNNRMEIWRMINPPSGSNNVVVTLSASGRAAIGAATFAGVNQTNPLGAFASATGSSTTPSVAVASAVGDLVFNAVASDSGGTAFTPGANQTERWDLNGGNNNIRGGASTEVGAAGNVTMSCTAGNSSWSTGGVSIKPAPVVSFSHATGTGTDRLLLVSLAVGGIDSTGNPPTVSSVTYGGSSMTQVATQASPASGTQVRSSIYRLLAPALGTANVVVTLSGSGTVTAGATTFTGVDQTTPLGTAATALGTGTTSTVSVTSATDQLVFGTTGFDASPTLSLPVGSGQTLLWNSTISSPALTLAGATSTEPGATTVTHSYSSGTSQAWATAAVGIRPAVTVDQVVFTQSPTFAMPFGLATGASITVTSYVNVISGTMPANPAISAVLSVGGTPFLTMSNPSYSGGLLTWTGTLGSAVNIAAGGAIALTETTTQSGVTYQLRYDSSTYPSKIVLPTTSIIAIPAFDVYDAPYPNGSPLTAASITATRYVRVKVSDPFGDSDITSVGLVIDGPGTSGDLDVTLGAPEVVASDSWSKTYEYVWNTTALGGTYDLTATAHEGLESITATATTTDILYASTLGGRVWSDLNANGVRDAGETGIDGVAVTLYNAMTHAVVSTTTTAGGGLYGFENLPPGTYQVGFGALSGYNRTLANQGADGAKDSDPNPVTGLTGNYLLTSGTVNNSIDAGYYQQVAIAGNVYLDVNGLTDNTVTGTGAGTNAGGALYANLIDNTNKVVQAVAVASGGSYSFGTVVPKTNYTVVLSTTPGTPGAPAPAAVLPGGWINTGEHLGAGAGSDGAADGILAVAVTTTSVTNANFGILHVGTVTGSVLADTDNNGSGDAPLGGVALQLHDATTNALIGTTTTDGSGVYLFSNVAPGSYKIVETQPSGYLSVSDKDGSNFDIIGDITPVAVIAGATNSGNDFVEVQSTAIGNLVWEDINNNGMVDPGEPGFDGITVQLWRDTNNDGVFEPAGADSQTPLATVTAGGGSYGFSNLHPGKYFVVIPTPPLYHLLSSTHTTVTVDTQVDNDDNGIQTTVGGTTISPVIDLSPGVPDNTIDFGFIDPGVGNLVWADLNNDGLVQADEPGIPNVLVELCSPGGTRLIETTTDANGFYMFTGQAPDSYVVSIPASNFQPGGALDHYSAASSVVVTSDNQTDDDNNGSQPGGPGTVVSSPLIVLSGDGEPVDAGVETGRGHELDNGDDAGADMTVDFGFTPTYSLGNRVFADNGDGTGGVANDGWQNGTEPGIAGVVVKLFAANAAGNPTGAVLATQTTDSGGYYRFDGLIMGTCVAVVDVANSAGLTGLSSSTGASADNTLAGDLRDHGRDMRVTFGGVVKGIAGMPVMLGVGLQPSGEALASGQGGHGPTGDAGDNLTLDFGFSVLGAISGYVHVGSAPLAGVTLTLLDAEGNPVDGDPNTDGVQLVTTVTGSDGSYIFADVAPGSYQVAQARPFGYNSFGDADGGDLDVVGDVHPVVVVTGQTNSANNFILALDTCPDTWAEWQFQHPGEQAGGNPDADAYDNLAEFAFAMPFDSGAGNAWRIQPSALNADLLEGVFVRPKGATDNVTYTLQHAAALGNPTVWLSTVITPEMVSILDNGDCTETVTIHNLEAVTGLAGGRGVVRLRADLDEDNDTVIDHSSYGEVEGWQETAFALSCRTYNNPFLREAVFTGTVGAVNGQSLGFATSAGGVDLAGVLTNGVAYYLEVTSGDHEGHRFDVVSASGNTLTLANDSSLNAAAAPFNTLTGSPPSTLVGASVVVRRHLTLDEVFPPTGFGATGSQSTADEVQVFAGGAWSIYWLYNNDGTPRWVDAADAGMANRGATVIPPGQGMFFNNRSTAAVVLAYGEVRANDFIRPLAAAYNLVGGGYPVDQSATGPAGRAMTLAVAPAAGFFGSRDFKTADSFFVWSADSTVGATGYVTYYLLYGAPISPSLIRWVKVGDASAAARGNETLLLGNHAVFLRCASAVPGNRNPQPWTTNP